MQLHCEAVPFRLQAVHGTRAPTVPRSQSVEALKAERKRQADEVRRMKQASHEELNRMTVAPRRRSDGGLAGATVRGRRRLTSDAAAWLASLQSVATEYRRAEAEERAAALWKTVQLRREERDDARRAAGSEMEQQRMRSAFVERKDRRVLSSELQRRASVHQEAVQSSLKARRRDAEMMSTRRENVNLAGDVARRIGACSKAHVRFVQQEHQDFRRQLAASAIQRQRNERRRRDAEVERVVEERRRAVATQADADRFVTDALYQSTKCEFC